MPSTRRTAGFLLLAQERDRTRGIPGYAHAAVGLHAEAHRHEAKVLGLTATDHRTGTQGALHTNTKILLYGFREWALEELAGLNLEQGIFLRPSELGPSFDALERPLSDKIAGSQVQILRSIWSIIFS